MKNLLTFGIIMASLNTSAHACEFKITGMTVKGVQAQSDLDPQKIDNFGEVILSGSPMDNTSSELSLNYRNSLTGERSVETASTLYEPHLKQFYLKLSENLASVFFTLVEKKNVDVLQQLSLLQLAISQGQDNCKITLNEFNSSPLQWESRRTTHTPYSAQVLESIYPLQKEFYSAATDQEKINIATSAYSILFEQKTPKLKALIDRSGITDKQAIQFAIFSGSEGKVCFPSVWNSWGPDFVAQAVLNSMQRHNQYGNLTNVEASDLVWQQESNKSEVLVIRTGGEEFATFQEFSENKEDK